MALLSADEILAADDRRYEIVPVPEWNGEVRVRSLTGRERDNFELSLQDGKKGNTKENFRARLVALCAVDADGKPIFTNKQQVVLLGNKSVSALQRVFDKCNEMNGFSEDDIDELTDELSDGDNAA
jgi:hypothetical protein